MIRFLLFLLLCLALSVSGCMDSLHDGGFPGEENDQGAPVGLSAAEDALRNHDVAQARQIYMELLNAQPSSGAAAAGLAVTDLLLVFGMEEVTELLIENLGAHQGIDANKLLYSEEGYLYWASKGVRWEDDGPYQGIRTLVADELPWSLERMASLPAFVAGLDLPVEQLARKLVSLANALKGVDLNLETALEDPNFVRLFIPGQVFHDGELTLALGKSELSTLRVIIALARSAMYFVAAYEHDWNLERAFGAWRENVEVTDSSYVPGFEPIDYTFDYLDRHLGRSVAFPERLLASRSALRQALNSGRDAIRFGLEEISTTTMTWEHVNQDDARALDDVLAALADALDGPQEIPHTSPALTLDLSSFFSDGRVLESDIPWFIQVDLAIGVANTTEPDYQWQINPAAVDAFFIEGVISPGQDDLLRSLLPGDEGLAPVIDSVLGAYLDTVRDVYLTTR
jgi:hypothetical protein